MTELVGDLVAVEDRLDALEGRLQAGSDSAGSFVSGTVPATAPFLVTA